MAEVTLEQLQNLVAFLKRNRVEPSVVENSDQARTMTEEDPLGHEWAVGELYYTVPIKGKS